MTIADVMEALHTIAPPELAEEWDNVGLMVGDPAAACDRAVVALEVDRAVVRRAAAAGAQLIVSHHPPIFHPLPRVTANDPGSALVLEAIRNGLALAAAHTNYDVAPGGVNDVLADLLDLQATEPLATCGGSGQAKIVVFTPPDDLEAVLHALAASGAGAIGQYRDCTFRTPGTGTFRGLADANPTIGQVGRREEVAELRVEAVLPLALAGRVTAAVRTAHSYEELAIDVYPLQAVRPGTGIGRCGTLRSPMRADRLVGRVKDLLGVTHVRVAGDLRRRVERVAVCGGSGGGYAGDAVRRGCQLYVTGDVSHHQALDAAAAGLVVVDAGHAATEAPAIPVLARRLGKLCRDVRITTAPSQARGPLRTL